MLMSLSDDHYFEEDKEELLSTLVSTTGAIEGYNIRNEIYDKEEFGKETFLNCRFEDCVFTRCNFADSIFNNCKFDNVFMDECDLEDTDFYGSEIMGYGTKYGLEIHDSSLTGAKFHGTCIGGLKLDSCDLSGAEGLNRAGDDMSPELVDCKSHPLNNMSSSSAGLVLKTIMAVGAAVMSSSTPKPKKHQPPPYTYDTYTGNTYNTDNKAHLFYSKGLAKFFEKDEDNAKEVVCTLHPKDQALGASTS